MKIYIYESWPSCIYGLPEESFNQKSESTCRKDFAFELLKALRERYPNSAIEVYVTDEDATRRQVFLSNEEAALLPAYYQTLVEEEAQEISETVWQVGNFWL